jgi:hypothetical protein
MNNMVNNRLLYKILRYIAMATLLYLLCRYFPKCEMNYKSSIVTTFIIILICIIVEQIYTLYLNNNSSENFMQGESSNSSCNSCSAEHFKPSENPPKKTCRVVCDDDEDGGGNGDGNGDSGDNGKSGDNGGGNNNGDGGDGNGGGNVGNNANANNGNGGVNGNAGNDGVNGNAGNNANNGNKVEGFENGKAEAEGNNANNGGGDMGNSMGNGNGNRNSNGNGNRNGKDESYGMDHRLGKSMGTATPDGAIMKAADNDTIMIEDKKPANDDRYYWGTRYGNLGYDDRYGFGGMFYDEYPFYNRYRNNDYDNIRNTGSEKGYANGSRKRREEESVREREEALEKKAHSLEGYAEPYQKVGSKSERDRTFDSKRRIEGTIDDELPYSDYNHLPIASGYKSHDYEYGYSFLPPEKWYPQPPRAPVCVTSSREKVCPTYAAGTPVDVKEWHSSRRVTPPDLINTDYIGEKLNSGR